MIKQTWEISNEERNRILSLHESATKNHYLMSEQGDESLVYDGTGASTLYDQDENYKYYITQPNYSDIGDYLDWNRKYYVLATNSNGTSFKCDFSKDEKGFPMDIKVLVDKPLPILSADPSRNQFLLGMKRTSKKSYNYTKGNEITKNAYIEGETTKGAMDTQLPTGNQIYAVFFERDGRPTTVVVAAEESGTFKADYDINFLELKIGSVTLFNPWNEGFYIPGRKKIIGRFSLYLPTQHNSYPLRPDFFNPGRTPEDTPDPIPNPPQPVSLGDKFANNISQPNRDAILNDPKFIEFKKFVEGNDMAKFVFVIESSASKCAAGYKEANSANGKWSDDKDNYPDVVVADSADKNDLGNLNLTKARAQNLKNFLITNLPKLKNSKFEVIAQGSIGICGTEAENQKYRKVNLDVRKL
jgi:hypothetical protein